jgi:glycine/D-amino acid oxidase-like deaminating enzyme
MSYAPQHTLNPFKTPFGFLKQQQTGYLLTRPLLACLKAFFIAHNCYRLADFSYQAIRLRPVLSWQDITPKHIIFCEGFHATTNPWFSWLPFQPVKGEILTLTHQSELPDHIINYGHWLIPLTQNKVRIGATFDRNQLNTHSTDAGKHELLTALQQVTHTDLRLTVLQQQANIRPCTLDKQPFIGYHPHQPQLAIFNGFGAKGSLQIPWYSQQFATALIHNTPLPANIERHYATHFLG